MSSMISKFHTGHNYVQIGVVTFDNIAYEHVRLNQYSDTRLIQNKVNKIPFTGQGTNTGIALKYILDRGFKPAAGDRPDAKDVLVVLTDGISINRTHTADQAYIFKERHIKVISIGIGRGANKQELIDMASVPGYVYQVTDFSKLAIIQNAIHSLVCNNDGKILPMCN